MKAPTDKLKLAQVGKISNLAQKSATAVMHARSGSATKMKMMKTGIVKTGGPTKMGKC